MEEKQRTDAEDKKRAILDKKDRPPGAASFREGWKALLKGTDDRLISKADGWTSAIPYAPSPPPGTVRGGERDFAPG